MEVPPMLKVRPENSLLRPQILKPRPLTMMTAAIIRFRELVKSTRFSTTLRTPMAEIMP